MTPSTGDRPLLARSPLIATKHRLPQLGAQLVTRPRAAALLDAGSRHHVTLVAAPPGSGKTTAVRAWAAHQPGHWPVCWLSIDEEDDNPRLLVRYLVEALRPVLDGDVNLAENIDGLDDYGSVASLIEALSGRARRFTLVLDGLEVLRSSAARTTVELLLRHRPPAMHTVLVTTSRSWPDLTRLHSAGEVTEIGLDDLAFDGDACSTFAQQILGTTTTRAAVNELARATGGWAMGIALVARSVGPGTNTQNTPAEGAIERLVSESWHIDQYMRHRVLDGLDHEDRTFLQRASILEELTAEACETILEDPFARRRLRRLSEQLLFLLPANGGQSRFTWQPCLRTVLRRELDERAYPAAIAALHGRAVTWFTACGDVATAIGHALDGDDTATAAQLAEDHLQTLGVESAALLRALARRAGTAALMRHPALATAVAGSAIAAGDHALAGHLLNELDRAAVGPGHTATSLDIDVSTLRAAVACIGGQSTSIDEGAVRVLNDASIHGRFQPVLEYYMALATRATGRAGQSMAALQERSRTFLDAGDINTYLYWQAMIAARYEAQGLLRASRTVYQEALSFLDRNAAPDHVLRAPLVLGLSALHRQRSEAAEMSRLVVDVRDRFLSENPERLCWLHSTRSCILLARASAALGRFDEADDYLELAEHRISRAAWIVDLADEVAEARVLRWTLAGDHDSLARWARASTAASTNRGTDVLGAILQGWAEFHSGQPQAAIETLTTVVEPARFDVTWGERLIRAATLRAVAEFHLGRMSRAAADLSMALGRAQDEHQVRVFVETHPDVRQILAVVMDQMDRRDGVTETFLAEVSMVLLEEGAPPPRSARIDSASGVVDLSLATLSPREREIYELLAAGWKAHRIAAKLSISQNTVKTHQRRIYDKLDIHDIEQIRRSSTRPATASSR